MSDDWDFYSCQVDGVPASIFLDLGIASDVPLQDRSYMAYVRVYMRAPRPDGLSSQEEFDALIRLEDRMTSMLTADAETTYVGRNTSGGCRDFYFYAADASDWAPRVAKALADFADYNYVAAARPDGKWDAYLKFLYPSPEDLERIHNRRVCDSLKNRGDALSQPREIDHWAYFPNENARARFQSVATSQGFRVRSLDHANGLENPFGVRLFRVDLPSFETIDAVTLPLHRAALDASGNYDGWETHVVSETAISAGGGATSSGRQRRS